MGHPVEEMGAQSRGALSARSVVLQRWLALGLFCGCVQACALGGDESASGDAGPVFMADDTELDMDTDTSNLIPVGQDRDSATAVPAGALDGGDAGTGAVDGDGGVDGAGDVGDIGDSPMSMMDMENPGGSAAGDGVCEAGLGVCGGVCVDLASDRQNCGACGEGCSGGGRLCLEGVCQCPPGTTDCDGLCVDLTGSAAHCGACGRACGGALLCTSGVCAVDGCGGGRFQDHDYLVCSGSLNHAAARDRCREFGLNLATVDSAEEVQFITDFTGGEVWIGLNDRNAEGTYRWVNTDLTATSALNNGELVSFQNWEAGEPNNDDHCSGGFLSIGQTCNDEDCIHTRIDGTWNDAVCGNSMAYLCESQ